MDRLTAILAALAIPRRRERDPERDQWIVQAQAKF